MRQALDPRELFAARLKALLSASGLSQKVAAAQASRRSVTPGKPPVRITNGQISAWANGTNRPSSTALRQLVRVLIEQARCIDERLVREGGSARLLLDGLLNEPGWAAWLQAAWGGTPPSPTPTVLDADPEDLGLHRAVAPDDSIRTPTHGGNHSQLTPYLTREHDDHLREHLAAALNDGISVFALLLGDSTTGKTRALYEAVLDQAPDNPLLHPADADDLLKLLDGGAIVPGTVLWLNETQRYLQGDGGHAIAKYLARRLAELRGVAMVGAMWRTSFVDLTVRGPATDPGPILDLLNSRHTVLLDVPDALTEDQCARLRSMATGESAAGADTRILHALDAGSAEYGRVIQHLSGGPKLLAAFRSGTLFTPVEHALVTAALDARRLGHHQPIPTALLAHAADGYLTVRQRPSQPDWDEATLRDLTCGYRRGDPKDRTDIHYTLTALNVHVVRSGTPPSFEPADYLDQHTRRDRQAELGPATLWDALASHTCDPADLQRLGQAAEDRGLFKHALTFYCKGVLEGHPFAGPSLINLALRRDHLDPLHHSLRWTAAHVEVMAPDAVTRLLRTLKNADATEAVSILSARVARNTSVTDPDATARLLDMLGEAGGDEAVHELAARAATQADPADPDIARLLEAMGVAGQDEAVRELSTRVAALVDPTDTDSAARLLNTIEEAGDGDAVNEWSTRASTQADLTDLHAVAFLVESLYAVGDDEAVHRLATRAVTDSDVTNPYAVTRLLKALRSVNLTEAVHKLASRAAAHSDITAPHALTPLLEALKASGQMQSVHRLATRAIAHVDITDPYAVTLVLEMLSAVDETEAAHEWVALAAARTDPGNPLYADCLLEALNATGDKEAVQGFSNRVAMHTDVTDPLAVPLLLETVRETGVEEVMGQLSKRTAAETHLSHPSAIARLLDLLKETGEEESVRILMDRHPTSVLDPRDPLPSVRMLGALSRANEQNALHEWSIRVAAHTSLTDRRYLPFLFNALELAGETEAVHTLSVRAATDADITDPDTLARLLNSMRTAGEEESMRKLSARAATHTYITDPEAIGRLLNSMRTAGEEERAGELSARAATHANATNPLATARLLEALNEANATEAVHELSARATTHAELTSPAAIERLLNTLKAVGAEEAAYELADRAAAQTEASDPRIAASLLQALTRVGETEAVGKLARLSIVRPDLSSSTAVSRLLTALGEAGEDTQAQILLDLAMNAGAAPPEAIALYGREADGRDSTPWTWSDLHIPRGK